MFLGSPASGMVTVRTVAFFIWSHWICWEKLSPGSSPGRTVVCTEPSIFPFEPSDQISFLVSCPDWPSGDFQQPFMKANESSGAAWDGSEIQNATSPARSEIFILALQVPEPG